MKRSMGITLVALVVTIIILLILAGVTLGMILGNNGIINISKKAQKDYTNAEEKETKDLDDLYSSILIATNDSAQVTINVSDLKTLIQEEVKKTQMQDKNPAGTILSYMGNIAPDGYLSCDGATYAIAQYPELAEQIKSQFGTYQYWGGDGETTFAVPDLRGEFLRGTGTSSRGVGVNGGAGANVGIHQNPTRMPSGYMTSTNGSMYLPHNTSTQNQIPREYDSINNLHNDIKIFNSDREESLRYQGDVGLVTMRPTNTSVLYCIKY